MTRIFTKSFNCAGKLWTTAWVLSRFSFLPHLTGPMPVLVPHVPSVLSLFLLLPSHPESCWPLRSHSRVAGPLPPPADPPALWDLYLPLHDPPGDGCLSVVAGSELQRGRAGADVGNDQVGWGPGQVWRRRREEGKRGKSCHHLGLVGKETTASEGLSTKKQNTRARRSSVSLG